MTYLLLISIDKKKLSDELPPVRSNDQVEIQSRPLLVEIFRRGLLVDKLTRNFYYQNRLFQGPLPSN